MQRLWSGLLACCAYVAAGVLAAIATAITINVILRSTGLPVLYGTLDAVEYGLLLACFLGAPWVLAQRAHVQVDLVLEALPPAAKLRVAQVISAIGCLLCLAFAYFGFQAMGLSAARGALIRTSFVIPEWWTLAVVPCSMLLCAIEFARACVFPTATSRAPEGL